MRRDVVDLPDKLFSTNGRCVGWRSSHGQRLERRSDRSAYKMHLHWSLLLITPIPCLAREQVANGRAASRALPRTNGPDRHPAPLDSTSGTLSTTIMRSPLPSPPIMLVGTLLHPKAHTTRPWWGACSVVLSEVFRPEHSNGAEGSLQSHLEVPAPNDVMRCSADHVALLLVPLSHTQLIYPSSTAPIFQLEFLRSNPTFLCPRCLHLLSSGGSGIPRSFVSYLESIAGS